MKKLISVILVMAMCFSMSICAFAAESGSQNTIEEEFTLADAAAILGIDEEELAGMKIQRLPSLGNVESGISPNATVTPIPTNLQSGYVYYEDVTITSSFTGAMHYMMGTKYMWGVTITTWNGNGSLGVQRWYGDNSYPDGIHSLSAKGERYDSGWIERPSGIGLYFKYYLNNVYISGTKKFRMVIAVS